MRSFYHPARDQIALASVLYALSDPVRLSIVETLSGGGEVSCGEFGMDLPKSTVSHHFRVLRDQRDLRRCRPWFLLVGAAA